MPQRFPARYALEKRGRLKTFRGYPLATIAYYGPDDSRASKVAVGILDAKDNIIEMRRWTSETADVRKDEGISQQIVEFLDRHQVQSVAMTDGLLGCPHEEGVDYPEGESCPKCPYWEGRDRFAGKIPPQI